MTATKMKATGMDGFNMLLSRKYLKLEKPIMKIQERRGRCSKLSGRISRRSENFTFIPDS